MLTNEQIIPGRLYKHRKTGKVVEILQALSWHKLQLKHASGRITVQQSHYFAYDYDLVPEKKTKDSMKNKGLHQYRFRDNPLEKKFAEAWEDSNKHGRTLEYLLAKDSNRPNDEVTDRDREVAATVIQWLGSPVGQGFISDMERVSKE